MQEIWKDIEELDGYYQVSNYGNLRSKDRRTKIGYGATRFVKGKKMAPVRCMNGYLEAQFTYNGTRHVYLIHRLVAMHFIPNPNNYPEVNHKDENLNNNRADNLEWCTSKYNANYGTRNIRMMENRVFIPVLQFDKEHNFIKRWDKMSDACRTTGADFSSMIRVCKGRQNTCVGYVWEYANKDYS